MLCNKNQTCNIHFSISQFAMLFVLPLVGMVNTSLGLLQVAVWRIWQLHILSDATSFQENKLILHWFLPVLWTQKFIFALFFTNLWWPKFNSVIVWYSLTKICRSNGSGTCRKELSFSSGKQNDLYSMQWLGENSPLSLSLTHTHAHTYTCTHVHFDRL